MGVGRGEKHLNIDIVLKLDIKKSGRDEHASN